MADQITNEMISTLEANIDKGWAWLDAADLSKGIDISKFEEAVRMCNEAENLLATARESQYEYERLDAEIKAAIELDPKAEVWIPQTMKRRAVANVRATSHRMTAMIFRISKVLGV